MRQDRVAFGIANNPAGRITTNVTGSGDGYRGTPGRKRGPRVPSGSRTGSAQRDDAADHFRVAASELSAETSTTVPVFFARSSRLILASSGSCWMHGAHHGAQKETKTTCPRNRAKETLAGPPSDRTAVVGTDGCVPCRIALRTFGQTPTATATPDPTNAAATRASVARRATLWRPFLPCCSRRMASNSAPSTWGMIVTTKLLHVKNVV